VKLARAFSYYNYKLKQLDSLLQQLIRDAVKAEVFTPKELLSVLWGYTRNHKADHAFYRELVDAIDPE
jgi:hypothetical protein